MGDGGQRTNGANGGGYVITIRREDFGEITNEESIHMGAAIKSSVKEAFTSEDNPIHQIALNVKGLRETLENQGRTADTPPTGTTQSGEEIQSLGTTARETNKPQKEIRSEERELENRLLNCLKEIIITIATFFIYFISFLGSFQQPSHDHFRLTIVAILVGVIWLFTGFLVHTWWFELTSIRAEMNTLEEQKPKPMNQDTSQGSGGKDLNLKICRGLVIFLGIVATLFSVYFACILCSQWSSGSSPAPSPSALPTFQLTTQDYAASQ